MNRDMLLEWSDVYVAARATGVILLVVSAPMFLLHVLLALPVRPRRFCPGPGLKRRQWLWPGNWILASVCGYDIRSLPTTAPGEVRCPECGRAVRTSYQARRRVIRWRAGTISILLLLTGVSLLRGVAVRTGRWQNAVPTTVLIAAKHGLGSNLPTRLRRELEGRISEGDLTTWQRGPVMEVLFRDLRADDQPTNAREARTLLGAIGLTDEQLEERLRSPDRQERQIIASILRDRCSQWFNGAWYSKFRPSDVLLEVTAEGLVADDLDWYNVWTDNALEGFEFLKRFPDRIDPLIEQGFTGGDQQQRFLCAALAAHTGKTEYLPFAAPVLIQHLRDNSISGDARFAIRALYLFGPDVVPFVRPHVDADDPQLATSARMLLRDLGAVAPVPTPGSPRLTILTNQPTTSDYGNRIPWEMSR